MVQPSSNPLALTETEIGEYHRLRGAALGAIRKYDLSKASCHHMFDNSLDPLDAFIQSAARPAAIAASDPKNPEQN
jgi:hypothetical protein